MPENRPIEQLLKDYAKKRQADAGPAGEMPPATRRRLLDEVRRTYPGPAQDRPGFLALILAWPRLLPALGLLLILSLVTWTLFGPRPDHPGPLAATTPATPGQRQNAGDTTARIQTSAQPATEGEAAATSDASAFADGISRSDSSGDLKPETPAPPPPAPEPVPTTPSALIATRNDATAPQPAIAPTSPSGEPAAGPVTIKSELTRDQPGAAKRALGGEGMELARKLPARTTPAPQPAGRDLARLETMVAKEPAPATASTLPTPLTVSAPPGANVEARNWSVKISFTNLSSDQNLPAIQNEPPAPGLLTSFTLLQKEETLQFVDSDGSVYAGHTIRPEALNRQTVRLRNAVTKQAAAQETPPPPAGSPAAPTHFRVSGTNLTLNRAIVISGTLAVSNAPAAVPGVGGRLGDNPPVTDLTGTVQFSSGETLQIKARSAGRAQ